MQLTLETTARTHKIAMAGTVHGTAPVSQRNPFQHISWPRPKYLLFAFIGLMYAYVLWNNESFLVNSKHPEWSHVQSFKWWLSPHGLAAGCALLLGPLQFSDRLRKRFARLHQVLGRLYVAGVFIGAPIGIYIHYFEERNGRPTLPHRRCWSRRSVVDVHHGHGPDVHPSRKSAAAPSMDDPQLCGRDDLSCGARDH
jgi:hypothetical protein